MASSGVWDLVGPSQQNSGWCCSHLLQEWAEEPLQRAGSNLLTVVPARRLSLHSWHCRGAEHPDTQDSWEGMVGSDPLISARRTFVPLAAWCWAGCWDRLGAPGCVVCPTHGCLSFLSFTESSCEGRGWVCLSFGPRGEELRIEIISKCGLTGRDVAFVCSNYCSVFSPREMLRLSNQVCLAFNFLLWRLCSAVLMRY